MAKTTKLDHTTGTGLTCAAFRRTHCHFVGAEALYQGKDHPPPQDFDSSRGEGPKRQQMIAARNSGGGMSPKSRRPHSDSRFLIVLST